MFRYVHTNIIAKDPKRLIAFYKEVLNCKSVDETPRLGTKPIVFDETANSDSRLKVNQSRTIHVT